MANKKNSKKASAKSGWTYKGWYENNKDKLSEKRRKRYNEDKKYRDKVLAQNKAYRDRKSQEQEQDKEGDSKPKVRIPKHRKPVSLSVKVHGKQVAAQLVHVGAFARAISRSVPTIHQWERVGLLPKTPYYLKGENKRERLYTSDMIRVVIGVLGKRGTTVSSTDPTFHKEIVDGWTKVGTVLEAG